MLLTGHQPNYLPYLGFFEKLVRADFFLVVDNVQFVKRGPFGWIHRNKVRTSVCADGGEPDSHFAAEAGFDGPPPRGIPSH